MLQSHIISGLRAKDRKTTEYLYEKYSCALCAVISRIISDQDILEEVFHDSFIRITRNIDSYEESNGLFYTWMVNICRNCAKEKAQSSERSQSA